MHQEQFQVYANKLCMNRKIGKSSSQILTFADDGEIPPPTNSESLILPDDEAGACHHPQTSDAELLSNDDVEFMDIEMLSCDDENEDSEACDEDDEASGTHLFFFKNAICIFH